MFGNEKNNFIDKKNDNASDIKFESKEDYFDFKTKEMQIESEIERNRWRNRRKMAWLSFFYLVISNILVFFVDITANRENIIINSNYIFLSIVLVYISANAIEHISIKKGK